MNRTSHIIIVSFLALTFVNCGEQHTNTSNSETEFMTIDEQIELSNVPDYQLANDLKNKLLINGIDTILFYKRTCIGCCDFYNLFWVEEGKSYLHKFYYSFDDEKTHSVLVQLNDNRIFKELTANYSILNETSIKENEHKMKDGTSKILMSSHYCYSDISIYTRNDSIISNQIKDTDFNKSSGISDEKGVEQPNDNYHENINSKWYTLLTNIEKEIASMDLTSIKEREITRVLK